jgi:hypothetical protein
MTPLNRETSRQRFGLDAVGGVFAVGKADLPSNTQFHWQRLLMKQRDYESSGRP